MAEVQHNGGVTIGDISEGIRNSNITGRDININFITQEEQPALFVGVPALPYQPLVGRDDLMATLIAKLTQQSSGKRVSN